MLGYIEAFAICALAYLVLFAACLKQKEAAYKIKFSVMYVYLFLVLCVTILPVDFTLDPKWTYHSSIQFTYVHIKPFHDLISGYSGAWKQILLNIIMTIPFGFLYAWLKRKAGLINVLTAALILSFTIEMIQLIMTVFLLHYRRCDVTDLITNVLGGVIGFLFYQFAGKIFKR